MYFPLKYRLRSVTTLAGIKVAALFLAVVDNAICSPLVCLLPDARCMIQDRRYTSRPQAEAAPTQSLNVALCHDRHKRQALGAAPVVWQAPQPAPCHSRADLVGALGALCRRLHLRSSSEPLESHR